MDPDEQKKHVTESKLSERYKFNASHVLPAAGLRSFIQDALKHHGQFLGYRYHILLYIRLILAALLFIIQDFKV
jgi:hypothetical protein